MILYGQVVTYPRVLIAFTKLLTAWDMQMLYTTYLYVLPRATPKFQSSRHWNGRLRIINMAKTILRGYDASNEIIK